MSSAERQRRFIANREAKAKAEAEARPDPYGLGPIVQVARLRQQPGPTASWLRDKLGDGDARALYAALGQALEKASPEAQAAAADEQARALDELLARLDSEIGDCNSRPPAPGEWCMAFSAAGLAAIVARVDALKARIAELERANRRS
jgi:hypothetical protein